jgi:MtaA/CmuA family methyltransferase
MKSRDLVLAALRGEPTDRLPVISACQHATYEQMERLGVSWPEAHSDGRMMAALAAGGYSELGLDAVRVPFSQTNEAEVLGAVLKPASRTILPSVDLHPYQLGEQPLLPADFLERGNLPAIIQAVRILKETIGDQVLIIGGIVGPFSIATNLVGAPPFLKTCFRKREAALPYLEVGEQAGTILARALAAAGADAIVVEDMMASMDMISPQIYRDLAYPYEKKQVAQIPVPVIMHICGAIDAILPDIARTGAAAISVEHRVKVREALEHSPELKVPLIGNIDPVNLLCQGTPEAIKEAVRQAVAAGVSIVSPGCAVAPDTPTDNLLAMVAAVKPLTVKGGE